MKRFLSIMVMALVLVFPFTVKAAKTNISVNCTNTLDASGNYTCTVAGSTDSSEVSNLTITLTEKGGAEITKVYGANDTDWTLSNSPEDVDGVWTVLLTSPGIEGEDDLFKFDYKPSGTEDCGITITLDGETKTVTPSQTPDNPTENKDTGATLPFVALGVVGLCAVGAYVVTKNKSKMYKI